MCPEAAPALFLIDELWCVVAYFSEHGSSTARCILFVAAKVN
jgi:hypothetical protein